MLVNYTPIATLTPDEQARLRAFVTSMTLEGQSFVVFEGKTISKADIAQHFPRTESRKPPGQALFG